MESDQATAAAALDELRRSQIAAFTRYPRLGPWYPPVCGLVAGLWVTFLGLGSHWLAIGGLVLNLVTILGARAYTRRRGVAPRLGQAPPAIRRAMTWFVVTLAAVIGVVVVVYRAVSWPAAAVVAFVAVTAFIAVYEEAYARAAAHDERDSGLFGRAAP